MLTKNWCFVFSLLFVIPLPSAAVETTSAPFNAIAEAIQQMGDSKCASRVNQVTNFLGSNQNSGALLMTPAEGKPNERIIPLVIEQINGNGSISLVSASFMPSGKEDLCQSTYDAITVWSDSCLMVAKKLYTDLEAERQLKNNVTVLSSSPKYKVFLLPVGNMCVSLKKEVLL